MPRAGVRFFDIAAGINYCANRTDIKVISMSLGGDGTSTFMYNAINYAVNTKGKLLVAAAGNNNSSTPIYPGGYSDTVAYGYLPIRCSRWLQ